MAVRRAPISGWAIEAAITAAAWSIAELDRRADVISGGGVGTSAFAASRASADRSGLALMPARSQNRTMSAQPPGRDSRASLARASA